LQLPAADRRRRLLFVSATRGISSVFFPESVGLFEICDLRKLPGNEDPKGSPPPPRRALHLKSHSGKILRVEPKVFPPETGGVDAGEPTSSVGPQTGWSRPVYIFGMPDHPGATGLASVRATPPASGGEICAFEGLYLQTHYPESSGIDIPYIRSV
jgi:hypothetical protein